MVYRTENGGTVEVGRMGDRADLWYRDADGRTVATVHMAASLADALTRELAPVER
jgi:hypothetical protein